LSGGRSATSSWPDARKPRLLLWTAVAAYSAGFTSLSVLRQEAFNTGRFDLGNMVQAVWTTAHGNFLQVTDLQGHQISRLGAHFDPILALFAPLWWIWPSPNLLLTAQAVIVALGALPVYWLARKHLASDRAALGFALAYLLYSPVQWLTLNEFHPVALACPFLLFAFWYLDENRLVPFAIFAVLAVTTKEEIGLAVAGMGAWYAFSRGRWRIGGATAVAGIAASLLAIEVLVPHFNHGASSRFYSRYSSVGGSPGGIIRTFFEHPLRLFSTAFDHRGIRYLLDLGLPLAGLFLLAPLVLLAALPELALNLLSKTPTQTSIHFHYTAGVIPGLMAAAIFGAARLQRRLPTVAVPAAALVVVAALIGNYRLGPLPMWRDLPGGSTLQARYSDVLRHDNIAARALRLIPGDAVVSATNSLGGHLSARRRILSFPIILDATWVAVDQVKLSFLDRAVAPLRAAVRIVRLRRDPQWRIVFDQDGVLVFKRRAPAPA
jgi:uncharacterized membrane protein